MVKSKVGYAKESKEGRVSAMPVKRVNKRDGKQENLVPVNMPLHEQREECPKR